MEDILEKADIDLGLEDSPSFKECQLQSDDVHHIPTLEVNTKKIHINLHSGGCTTDMRKVKKDK